MPTNKEHILEITEEDYKEGLAKGWTDDDMLPVGKHKFRKALHAKDVGKEKITMNVDSDILDYFREASKESGAGYQTLINRALRDVVNGRKKVADYESILQDQNFLRLLKRRLETVAA